MGWLGHLRAWLLVHISWAMRCYVTHHTGQGVRIHPLLTSWAQPHPHNSKLFRVVSPAQFEIRLFLPFHTNHAGSWKITQHFLNCGDFCKIKIQFNLYCTLELQNNCVWITRVRLRYFSENLTEENQQYAAPCRVNRPVERLSHSIITDPCMYECEITPTTLQSSLLDSNLSSVSADAFV